VVEDGAGTPDTALLPRADTEERLLLTFDKGFGERIFKNRAPFRAGIILIRFSTRNPSEAAERVVAALQIDRVWRGRFSVITRELIRSVRLPDLSG
jgi:hypothetical protein